FRPVAMSSSRSSSKLRSGAPRESISRVIIRIRPQSGPHADHRVQRGGCRDTEYAHPRQGNSRHNPRRVDVRFYCGLFLLQEPKTSSATYSTTFGWDFNLVHDA